jgi:hypothetical protein
MVIPLIHVKGYAAPETKAAVERARLLIEQAEAMGDPLLLFPVLYGFWVASYVEFNGDAMSELAAQFLALAQKQATTSPLIKAHRVMGIPCCAQDTSRNADPTTIRQSHFTILLAARFSEDARVSLLIHFVVARLSRGGARGHRLCANRCARDRPSCHPNVRAGPFNPFLLRKLRGINGAIR